MHGGNVLNNNLSVMQRPDEGKPSGYDDEDDLTHYQHDCTTELF